MLRRYVVAQHRIVEILVPVHLLCSRDVAGVVEQDVLIALDDSQRRVVEMLGEPVRADENFGMHVALAGDARIDGGCIACDCRPHGSLLKKESFKHYQTEIMPVQVGKEARCIFAS